MLGLDWTNEPYSRLHRRDTPAWLMLGWESQALWMSLLRKFDRAGVIPLDPDSMPYESIAALLPHWPPAVVERSLERLLEKRFYEHDKKNEWLLDPEFLEREEAAMSDRLRQRESRARRRDQARREGGVTERDEDETERDGSVTERDGSVTAGHARSHAVTPGHTPSQSVTPSYPSVPSSPSEPEEEKKPPSTGVGGESGQGAGAAPDEAQRNRSLELAVYSHYLNHSVVDVGTDCGCKCAADVTASVVDRSAIRNALQERNAVQIIKDMKARRFGVTKNGGGQPVDFSLAFFLERPDGAEIEEEPEIDKPAGADPGALGEPKKLTPQQERVGLIWGVYEKLEIEKKPTAGAVSKWCKMYADAKHTPADLARDLESMAGMDQLVNGTSYVFKCLQTAIERGDAGRIGQAQRRTGRQRGVRVAPADAATQALRDKRAQPGGEERWGGRFSG